MSYQKSAQHEEADKVNNGKVAATAKLLPWLKVRLWVTALSWETGQHDLLPRLTRSTPVCMHLHICMQCTEFILVIQVILCSSLYKNCTEFKEEDDKDREVTEVKDRMQSIKN